MTKKRKKNNEDLVYEYQNEIDKNKKKKIADIIYRKVYKLLMKNVNSIPDTHNIEQSDLIQEASLIFMKCLNKFDTTKGLKFSTYFGDACRYELKRFVNKQLKHTDNSYYIEIDEILTAKPDNIENKIDDKTALRQIENSLLSLNRQKKITEKQFFTIIEEHGLLGCTKKTRKQIADERNCTLQNIGFLYRKAVDKIKDDLATQIL